MKEAKPYNPRQLRKIAIYHQEICIHIQDLEVIILKNLFHQLITVDDLFEFKNELLSEFLAALKSQANLPAKNWMTSHEVRRLLKVLPGTFFYFARPAFC